MANMECRLTQEHVHDMIKTYSQVIGTSKSLQHSRIIWPVGPNRRVFVYVLSDCQFECRCKHLKFKYPSFFELEVLDI